MDNRYDKFTTLILNISRYIQKIKNFEMENFGLKGNYVQCIYHLYKEKEGVSAKVLSLMCGEDKSAISRTIKELENAGYVFIEEKESQKYRNPIKLTKKGEILGEQVALKIENILNIASDGILEDEREKFYSQLTLISGNLQKICNEIGEK